LKKLLTTSHLLAQPDIIKLFDVSCDVSGTGLGGVLMQEGDLKVACFCEDAEGTFWFKKRLVVPKKVAPKKKILDGAHTSRYSIHPGSTKIYHDLRQQFWWTIMKAHYVSECDTCQKVKTDYIKPKELLQLMSSCTYLLHRVSTLKCPHGLHLSR
jgi:hypothetical protein